MLLISPPCYFVLLKAIFSLTSVLVCISSYEWFLTHPLPNCVKSRILFLYIFNSWPSSFPLPLSAIIFRGTFRFHNKNSPSSDLSYFLLFIFPTWLSALFQLPAHLGQPDLFKHSFILDLCTPKSPTSCPFYYDIYAWQLTATSLIWLFYSHSAAPTACADDASQSSGKITVFYDPPLPHCIIHLV